MRKRILWGLLFMTVAISAWGLIVEEAMAGELRPKEDFTVEVVARRAPLGITVKPVSEGDSAPAPLSDERDDNRGSSESSEDRSED